MQPVRSHLLLARLVAYVVVLYGAFTLADSLLRQLRFRHGVRLDLVLITVPQVSGLGFMYLGTLLLRRKYNAWLTTMLLLAVSLGLDMWHMILTAAVYDPGRFLRPLATLGLLLALWLARPVFAVRSDARTFRQALLTSFVVLFVAFLYGLGGFSLMDERDFHREISLSSAAHQTVDQFGLTDDHPVAHTRRARLFLDSLSVVSVAAVGYAAISFFSPIRARLVSQTVQRAKASRLLDASPDDLDDYFKLWPYDKLYYFDDSGEAAISYRVVRGVALVVGSPYGDPKHVPDALDGFLELCFVNDWLPAFIHVDPAHRELYAERGFRRQKIGEEAILDLDDFAATARDKHFRNIRNRFEKQGCRVELVRPPHSSELLARLGEISNEWLARPGRAERGFMMGPYSSEYMQQCTLALLYDADGTVQGFMNLLPTHTPAAANYDLLRVAADAPGNATDYLVMELAEQLRHSGVRHLNLGLSPLAGVDKPDNDESTLVDRALRFAYSNGDRLYSFSGLHRFKAKFRPTWEARYIVYQGGVGNFTRILAALGRAMRVK